MSGVPRKQNLNPKVRVIAKIRGSSHLDGLSTSWISVHNNIRDGIFSHSLTFSLGDRPVATSGGGGRKEAYVVDYCYEQNEKNDLVFEREVKPFINEVFDGRNATIIACGARGTGKSYLFQGTDDEPGLTVLAVDEMLRLAADNGKSIAVSFYEVDQDHHVKDLLDPNRQQVFVLKDAHGKTQLKGLSQVSVTSVSQFHNFYGGGTNPRKSIQKAVTELPKRSHKGLIVYVSSHGGEKLDVSVSKLNFVDLAGYQDARRKSIDGHNLVESTRNINKSIHAIHNVVYSLKANETHVPYRESKITTMLQDSLGGAGRILMVTCLNPSFCQESIYMVKLASRSCQGSSWAITDSTKKANSSARPMVPSSHNSRMLGSVSTSVKKQIVSRGHISGKKAHCSTSTLKARKLFDESSDLISQKITVQPSSSNNVPTVESVMHEADQLTSNVAKEASSLEVEGVSLFTHEDSNSVSVDVSPVAAISSTCETTILDKEASPLAISSTCEITVLDKADEDQNKTVLYTGELSMFNEGKKIDKENNSSIVNQGGSPPISAQLQELSNSLKLLCSSTPSCMDITLKNDAFHNQTSTDIGEPTTPSSSMRVTNREITSFCSPWEKFNARSTGMKNSLVQDYLRLLNTADKEELRKLKGIGEKRATSILELREDCPEPFKNLDDLKDIGLSAKQVKGWLKKEVGGLFD
ncbi:kinesin-like protein KIN-10C isoform X8 [Populus trichocarpa]|uniref:kinesin-like protein KIN-10C isoform X8 n=1 Tax=Populus trichocarpa TaxID=3694 RepID=UPI002278E0EB|nr:kinesin-like protein KIN-10C isoform X8 [Populus trichocarpa]